MELIFLGTGCILSGGVFCLFLPERLKAALLVCLTGLGAFFIIPSATAVLLGHIPPLTWQLAGSQLWGNIRLVLDPLAAFFILMTVIISFLCALYAAGYMRQYYGQQRPLSAHFFFLSLLIAAMLLVPLQRNAFAFLVIWELMSLSSFFLVSFENEKPEVFNAGLTYFIAMHVGVLFLMAGFLYLGSSAGSFDFAAFPAVLAGNADLTNILFLLFFIGFGTKAGFIPLHTWLPKAHPAAPSHVSALMSGVMIKTGIYGIIRVITWLYDPSLTIAYGVLIIGLISAIWGLSYAIGQHDIKTLLAYSSVENIGLIGLGLGLGLLGMAYDKPLLAVLGFGGGLLHILNHSIFKTLLFCGAGAVYERTHTREIEDLGGLIQKMPWTALCFLAGTIAICGLPPLNGFISEFLLYSGMLNGLSKFYPFLTAASILSMGGLALVGAMALLCFTRLFGIVFLGTPRRKNIKTVKEMSPVMLIPMIVLAVMTLLIGLFPGFFLQALKPLLTELCGKKAAIAVLLPVLQPLRTISNAFMILIVVAGLIALLRGVLLRRNGSRLQPTWSCGYQTVNPRMQYTASSFAAPFMALITPLLYHKTTQQLPKGLFPPTAHYGSHMPAFFDRFMYRPFSRLIWKGLNSLSWIQSGNTQTYLLYGLIFLVVALCWIVWGPVL
jgi:hydrogenase-4 component B